MSDARSPLPALLALTAAVILSTACRGDRPPEPRREAPRPPAVAAAGAASGAPRAERHGVVIRSRIAGIDTAYDARRILAITRARDGTAAIVVGEQGRRETTLSTYRLVPSGDPLQPASTRRVRHAVSPAARPLVVGLPGRGFVILRATDNIGAQGRGASLFVVPASAELDISAPSIALDLEGWLLTGAPSAARLGDGVVICFAGVREGEQTGSGIVCGRLDAAGRWLDPPVLASSSAVGGQGFLGEAAVGGDGDRLGLLTYYSGGEVDRVLGRLLSLGELGLVVGAELDLTGLPIGAHGAFSYRSPPRFAATADGVAFALPGFAETIARAGFVGSDGALSGGLRQVPELASAFEVALALPSADPAAIAYDSYGRRGERSAIFFGREAPPFVADLPSPLGPQARLRNGAAGAGLVAMVYEDAGGEAVVVVFEQPALVSRGG